VRFPKDHTGQLQHNPDTVNYTPEAEVADNDYAVGKLIQDIANSQYKSNTLIFVVEDDAHGGDHVDAPAALRLSWAPTSNRVLWFPRSTTRSILSAPSNGF